MMSGAVAYAGRVPADDGVDDVQASRLNESNVDGHPSTTRSTTKSSDGSRRTSTSGDGRSRTGAQ